MNDTDKLYDDITKIISSRHPRIKGAYCGLIAYGVMGYIAALNSDRAAAKVGANVAAEINADIKRLVELADKVGRSRQSNNYAMNGQAVEDLVSLKLAIFARVDSLAAGAPAETPQPVGQTRDDIERCPVIWFGTRPPHGTMLYAAQPAPIAGDVEKDVRAPEDDEIMPDGMPRRLAPGWKR